MNIISHRGFWHSSSEKNELVAFDRALSHGFGIETDIRDCGSNLVISHDFPKGIELGFENFLDLYCSKTKDLIEKPWLALNIKADGMAIDMLSSLKKFNINEYFVFDMSFPDMRLYAQNKIDFYTRMSEFEPFSSLGGQASGIWLDSFEKEWFDLEVVSNCLNEHKKVALVSSELHGREFKQFWHFIKANMWHKNANMALCTDFPELAKEFFRG